MKVIRSEKQQKALDYALNYIENSVLKPYIAAVYLFGSCARGEEHFDSDVDLLVEFTEDFEEHKKDFRKDILLLRSNISSDELHDAETDLKIVIGKEWENSKMFFYKDIRKEGINVWH